MKNKIIEIKEEIIIGDRILEVGDRIKVLNEDRNNTKITQILADEVFRGSFEVAASAILRVLDLAIIERAIKEVRIQYSH